MRLLIRPSVHLASSVKPGVRESVNELAASAASPDYIKCQAAIKSAASAASLREGHASDRLDHGLLFAIFGNASEQNRSKDLGLCASLHKHCQFAL